MGSSDNPKPANAKGRIIFFCLNFYRFLSISTRIMGMHVYPYRGLKNFFDQGWQFLKTYWNLKFWDFWFRFPIFIKLFFLTLDIFYHSPKHDFNSPYSLHFIFNVISSIISWRMVLKTYFSVSFKKILIMTLWIWHIFWDIPNMIFCYITITEEFLKFLCNKY